MATNTAMVATESGMPYLPLQPGDIVVLYSITASSTVAVTAGALSTEIT